MIVEKSVRVEAVHPIPGCSVTPFLRQAILADIVPRPDKAAASEMGHITTERWPEFVASYTKLVSRAFCESSPPLRLKPLWQANEQPRYRAEGGTRGDTIVVDFPLFCAEVQDRGVTVGTRLCIAICSGLGKSKIWSRVGLLESDGSALRGLPLGQVGEFLSVWRRITHSSTKLALRMLNRVISDRQIRDTGILEIVCQGVRDQALLTLLDIPLETAISATDLLKNRDVKVLISRHVKCAVDLQDDLEDIGRREPKAFWFSSPTNVTTREGFWDVRQALYLARQSHSGRGTQAVGLIYDDTASGDAAHESVRKVSVYLAEKVVV